MYQAGATYRSRIDVDPEDIFELSMIEVDENLGDVPSDARLPTASFGRQPGGTVTRVVGKFRMPDAPPNCTNLRYAYLLFAQSLPLVDWAQGTTHPVILAQLGRELDIPVVDTLSTSAYDQHTDTQGTPRTWTIAPSFYRYNGLTKWDWVNNTNNHVMDGDDGAGDVSKILAMIDSFVPEPTVPANLYRWLKFELWHDGLTKEPDEDVTFIIYGGSEDGAGYTQEVNLYTPNNDDTLAPLGFPSILAPGNTSVQVEIDGSSTGHSRPILVLVWQHDGLDDVVKESTKFTVASAEPEAGSQIGVLTCTKPDEKYFTLMKLVSDKENDPTLGPPFTTSEGVESGRFRVREHASVAGLLDLGRYYLAYVFTDEHDVTVTKYAGPLDIALPVTKTVNVLRAANDASTGFVVGDEAYVAFASKHAMFISGIAADAPSTQNWIQVDESERFSVGERVLLYDTATGYSTDRRIISIDSATDKLTFEAGIDLGRAFTNATGQVYKNLGGLKRIDTRWFDAHKVSLGEEDIYEVTVTVDKGTNKTLAFDKPVSTLEVGDDILIMHGFSYTKSSVESISGNKIICDCANDVIGEGALVIPIKTVIIPIDGTLSTSVVPMSASGFLGDGASDAFTVTDIAPTAVITADRMVAAYGETLRLYAFDSRIASMDVEMGDGSSDYMWQVDGGGYGSSSGVPYRDYSISAPSGPRVYDLIVKNADGLSSVKASITIDIVAEIVKGFSTIIDGTVPNAFSNGYREEQVDGGREPVVETGLSDDSGVYDSLGTKERALNIGGRAVIASTVHPIDLVNTWRAAQIAAGRALAAVPDDLVTMLYLEENKALIKLTIEKETAYCMLDTFSRTRMHGDIERRSWEVSLIIVHSE